MKKVKIVTKELMDQRLKLANDLYKIDSQIVGRIDYILNFWFKAFNNKIMSWSFSGRQEGESYSYQHVRKDALSDIIVFADYNDDLMQIILKDGKTYSWEAQILTRWLFEDSFEEEILNGKKLMEKKNAKLIQSAVDKEGLIKSAKKKLTKDELKALLSK